MTTKQAAEILIDFNLWRRGEGKYTNFRELEHTPTEIGNAIDIAVSVLKTVNAGADK